MFRAQGAVGFGETWGVAESANTDQMLTAEGQLEMAQWQKKPQAKADQARMGAPRP